VGGISIIGIDIDIGIGITVTSTSTGCRLEHTERTGDSVDLRPTSAQLGVHRSTCGAGPGAGCGHRARADAGAAPDP
jgi:hypothetical protein